jgi:hypothetical protein
MQPDLTPSDADTPDVVPAPRVLVDSPSWAGWILLSIAIASLIGAIVLTATGPIEWAIAAAIVTAATAVPGFRRLYGRP